MTSMNLLRGLSLLAVLAGLPQAKAAPVPANTKVKIFILAGQSNMVGFGQVAGSPGTMETYVKSNPGAYGHLVDAGGSPVVRNDVWVVNLSQQGREQTGWLNTGFGATGGHIGPEYAFGLVVGDHYDDLVLLIKCAWGGRSLYHDFLPPSARKLPPPAKEGDEGFYYAETLRLVKEVAGNLERYCPWYAGQGYEIVGFGWHQGWNDRINPAAVDAYESNMAQFIHDFRRDLGIEKLPFVIANTGMGGWNITGRHKERVEKLMLAQLALGDRVKHPEFEGNVAGVETRGFQRSREESPSGQEYHWMRNWETYYLIGQSMGEEIVRLISGKLPASEAR
jgi:alpha-galactosidase